MKPAELARSAGQALLQAIPSLVGGGFFGALKGVLLQGLLGVGLAGATAFIWSRAEVQVPAWLFVTLVLTPVVLGLAGGYTGAIRGVLQGLAEQLVEKRLVAWVYALVKPACVTAVKRLREAPAADAASVAARLQHELEQSFAGADEEGAPASKRERVVRFVAQRSRRVFVVAVVGHVAGAKSAGEAVAQVESLTLPALERVLVETLEDLFSLKLMLVTVLSLLLCVAPQLVFVVLRSRGLS